MRKPSREGGGVILNHRRGGKRSTRVKNRSYLNAFFVTLIFLAIGLSVLTIHLTSHIGWKSQHPINNIARYNNDDMNNKQYGASPHKKSSSVQRKVAVEEQTKSAINDRNDIQDAIKNNAASAADDDAEISDEGEAAQTQLSSYPNGPKTDPQYLHHRVYCMVPFIWNKPSYDVIMSTWGRRCNTINFLTDSMVISGKGSLQGDMINEDQNEVDGKVYKHHTEFPMGTFPDNVIFINMTRPWTGCKDGKTDRPKLCRHIWEKM